MDNTNFKMKLAFLLYESRSGSTMLASNLYRVAGINVMPENNFIPRLLLSNPQVDSPESARRSIDLIYQERQFEELDISKTRFYEAFDSVDGKFTTKELCERCIRVVATELNYDPQNLILIKCACYETMKEIGQIWPETRFVHIVRDGRAVFNSLRSNRSIFRDQPMNDNVVSAALSWSRKVKMTKECKTCLTIRYEDYLRNEPKLTADILEFLEIPPDKRFADDSKGEFSERIGESQRDLHKNVGKASVTSRGEAWRAEMPESLIAAYELIAARALASAEYPLDGKFSFVDRAKGLVVAGIHALKLPLRFARVFWAACLSSNDIKFKVARRLRRWKSNPK